MKEEKMARVGIMIPESLHKEYVDTIRWGLRQHLIAAIMRLIVDAVKKDGMLVVGAILSGEYKLVHAAKITEKDRMRDAIFGGD